MRDRGSISVAGVRRGVSRSDRAWARCRRGCWWSASSFLLSLGVNPGQPPIGSICPPVPARTFAFAFIGSHLLPVRWVCAVSRVPARRRFRRWGTSPVPRRRGRSPSRGSSAAGAGPRSGAGAAVRADAGALTGADVRGRDHRCAPADVCRVSRAGTGPGLRRRGCVWWRASGPRRLGWTCLPVDGTRGALPAVTASGRAGAGPRRAAADAGRSVLPPPALPVVVDADAGPGADARLPLHGSPPFGSTPRPFPARTVVCALIAPPGCRRR